MRGPVDTVERGRPGLPMSWRPSLSPGTMLRHCPIRDAELLVVPERIVVLNDEAAAIVRLCDGRRTVQEIAAEFPPEALDDVAEFLEDVRTQGWMR